MVTATIFHHELDSEELKYVSNPTCTWRKRATFRGRKRCPSRKRVSHKVTRFKTTKSKKVHCRIQKIRVLKVSKEAKYQVTLSEVSTRGKVVGLCGQEWWFDGELATRIITAGRPFFSCSGFEQKSKFSLMSTVRNRCFSDLESPKGTTRKSDSRQLHSRWLGAASLGRSASGFGA